MEPRKNNYIWLLVGLVPLLVLSPILRELGELRLIRQTAVSAGAIFGIWGLTGKPVWFHRGLWLAAAILVSTTVYSLTENDIMQVVTLFLVLLFYAGTLILVLRNVLFDRPVDANKILGALCAYLLIGVSFTILYQLTHLWNPESFRGLAAVGDDVSGDLGYFSFVTLTTLGYGDTVPASPIARSLALGEAVIGQFFIAVVVAGLVALLVSDPRRLRERTP
jgi:voltage-gated potassium channel